MASTIQALNGNRVAPAYERIPLRRPRFTTSEVIILNELVNAAPKPVTLRRLHKLLSGYSRRPYPITNDAIRTHVVNIRAKLGEASRKPTAILTTHVETTKGEPELAYFYREGE
jgi:DNA-binding response OmpR family regulator